MKNKGFTLIELLAVIIILTIIALIATPIVLNIIEDSKKSAFVQSANGIIDAAEYYYMNKMLIEGNDSKGKTFVFPNDTEQLKFDGEIPKWGSVSINNKGQISIGIKNERYCITKTFDSYDIEVTDDIENCKYADYVNGIMASENSCIIEGVQCSEEKIKSDEGIKVNVQVSNDISYDFYVINDVNNELTLIMDRNLYDENDADGGYVAWINSEDYKAANLDNTTCNWQSCYDEGPLTALKVLKERTGEWTNIAEKGYIFSDDGGGNHYSITTPIFMRARLLTYSEAKEFNCDSGCADFLYKNLKTTGEGYWLSTAAKNSDGPRVALFINSSGKHDSIYVWYTVNQYYSMGIRPVITITK